MRCDYVEIEQVLINLINNAIDAVSKLPDNWVKVSLHEDARSAVITVIDSGFGIPEAVRDKLFEPMCQYFSKTPILHYWEYLISYLYGSRKQANPH